MDAMRSFIVRIYGRRGSQGLRGTLEPVAGPAPVPPQTFANDAELLSLMRTGRKAPGAASPREPDAGPEETDPRGVA